MSKINVNEFFEEQKDALKLSVLAGKGGLNNKISSSEATRPGLSLTGFMEYFVAGRILVFGGTEIAYLKKINSKARKTRLGGLLNKKIPCIVISRGLKVPNELIDVANSRNIPILKSMLSLSSLSNKIFLYLEDKFSGEVSMHGVLLDVYGVGVLILGRSGVGKSESALALVRRGHRLVADDIVNIKLKGEDILMAKGNELIRHHMEIRGLGIINIQNVFGVGSIRNRKRIGLVIELEEWDLKKEYDRLGLEEKTMTILGVEMPDLLIPVRPGRDIATLVEVAAMNQRLKRMGFHSAKDLSRKLMEEMKSSDAY